MTDIISSPVRVNGRSRTCYFLDGDVAVEIVSGSEEQQKAVLALVGQAQRMAALLKKHLAGYGGHNCHTTPPECDICGPIEECLRAAGVLDE